MGRRLIFFAIGIGLGLLLVKLFFGRRDDIKFNYLPNTRVVNLLIKHPFEFTEASHCQSKCLNLNRENIKSLTKQGDVDFGDSDIRGVEKKKYLLRSDSMDLTYTLRYSITDTIATLESIELENKGCSDCL